MATGGESLSTAFGIARNVYRREGLRELLRTGVEYAISRPRLHPGFHWWLASAYYRRRCVNDVVRYDPPVDPFQLEWVSPDRIQRHTRREYPPYRGRMELFGAVKSGDWDVRDAPPVDPSYDGPPASLFLGETFEDSVLCRSFEAHFEDGIPWEETELVTEALRLVSEPSPDRVWHECQTKAEVRQRCRLLDDLFESVDCEGFYSQRQRLGCDSAVGFRHCLRHEITVDVGRNGELLLVSGKHRLAIAKLLDIERVPVVFLVRHESWMDHREALARQGQQLDHPDVPALAGSHS